MPFIVSPMLYALVLVPVFVGVVACIAWLEHHGGLHASVWRTGDVELAMLGALPGGGAFTAATLLLVRLERLDRPAGLDHLRHCALLYLAAAVWLVWLVANYARLGRGLEWGLVATATAMAVFGALVNAVTLRVLARRRWRATATSVPGTEGT